jgi:hypothetical protein
MQQCAICGKLTDSLTPDHLPPEGIFGRPRPAGLIAVPARSACNQGSSKDDEYFRVLAVELHASKVGDATGVTGAIMRSLDRPQARGFRHLIYSAVEPVWLRRPTGLLTPGFTITVKTERLLKTVERTIRGLYYHVSNNEPLPAGSRVWASLYDQAMVEDNEALKAELQNTVVPALAQEPEVQLGDGTFAYRYARDPDHRCCTAWWLVFFRRFRFVGLTIPPDAPALLNAAENVVS